MSAGVRPGDVIHPIRVFRKQPAARSPSTVPSDLPARLTYRSRQGERHIKHVVDGELRRAVSGHGIHRPTPESAAELDTLVRDRVNAPRR